MIVWSIESVDVCGTDELYREGDLGTIDGAWAVAHAVGGRG